MKNTLYWNTLEWKLEINYENKNNVLVTLQCNER